MSDRWKVMSSAPERFRTVSQRLERCQREMENAAASLLDDYIILFDEEQWPALEDVGKRSLTKR